MPDAHTQTVTLHIEEHYPEHEARTSDKHYAAFNACRRHLAKIGRLKCWVGNHECAGTVELHHAACEFALANGVDVVKFEETYPELNIHDEEGFLEYLESEGGLLPLCVFHHRGRGAIHALPYPVWLPQRFYRDDLPSPAVLITGPASVEVPAGAAAVVEAVTP